MNMRSVALCLKTVAALVLVVALALPGLAAGPKNISSTQAIALLAKDKKIVVVDVRTPDEYRQAHLRGARLIPLAELERRVKEIPRDQPVLVYCSVGVRSASAANLLASKGYPEVYQISVGLVGWYKNGYPLER